MDAPKTWHDLTTHYIRVLDSMWYKQLVKLQNLISFETARFYHDKGIITMHLPITTGSISSPMGLGSDSLPVKINLFGVDTYLADSMQFMLEYGCRLNERGCYYVMPSFRGESADERHLCQFYHSEVEIPGSLDNIINLIEEYVIFLSRRILEEMGEELNHAIGDIDHIKNVANQKGGFTRLEFEQAVTILKDKFGSEYSKYVIVNEGWRSISREGEQELLRLFGAPLWLTHFDVMAVPFYQQVCDNGNKAKNADLLMGIGETVGCGERHVNAETVMKSLKLHGVNPESYEWYINMKRYKPMQTAGAGMGIERFLMWVLKARDIRDFQICPRDNGKNIIP